MSEYDVECCDCGGDLNPAEGLWECANCGRQRSESPMIWEREATR